jgi:hypothetical protein
VNEFDARVFDLLDAFTSEPRRRPDWQDVLHRTRRRHTRRLVVALAAAVAVLACAAGVTAALGGFHAWLSGSPGKPASKAEQEKLASFGFPKDTKLRELIRTTVDGNVYVLLGFRSGESLCLRLRAVSLGHSLGPTCAPAARLRDATAPILPVAGVGGFEDKHARPSAAVSYGIAADGLSRVLVRAVDGDHRAILGGNAYLWVQNEPDTGQKAISVTAISSTGSRVTLPISRAGGPFAGRLLPARPARGPTQVQRRIPRPTVGWYVRGEKRGVGLSAVRHLRIRGGAALDDSTRLVKPDPQSNALVGLTGRWCLVAVVAADSGPALSCSGPKDFWSLGPLNYLLTSEGDLFGRVSGVAADGVASVVIFLGDGQRQPASLRDNLFTALVANDEFPVRIVGYDLAGRVVGIVTPHVFGADRRRVIGPLRRAFRTQGPNGVVAVTRLGPTGRGTRCWRVDMSTGESPGACLPAIVYGPAVWVDLVQPAGRDIFVIGHARGPITRVQLEFPNGDVLRTRPIGDVFVFAVPKAHLTSRRQTAFVRGYPISGLQIQTQGVVFKVRR